MTYYITGEGDDAYETLLIFEDVGVYLYHY